MTISQLTNKAIAELAPIYDDSEARWIMRISLEHLTGWSRTDLIIKKDQEASPTLCTQIDDIISRLLKNEPIQYILGSTYWHGLTLKVNKDVLIPRQETSELVDIIEKDFDGISDLNVLDICTGSGCIAIALSQALPFSTVTATDISVNALKLAQKNANNNKAKVNFLHEDALISTSLPAETFDIVVSNPPYIIQSEEKDMNPNVLDYEPHSALFVPDNEPLKFYIPISENALKILRPGGHLYLEINPLFCNDLHKQLSSSGWADIQIIKDIHGKDRFISACKAKE